MVAYHMERGITTLGRNMATSEQINAVVDHIVAAFSGNPALFRQWLDRSKLETDLLMLQSQRRALEATKAAGDAAYQEAVAAKDTEIAAKTAQIDAS